MGSASPPIAGRSPGLRLRMLRGELMDDPAIDPAEHRKALRGLARLNRLSAASAPIWNGIRRLLIGGEPHPTGRPLRLLDVACGSGDVAIGVAKRAQRAGVAVELVATDVSATALAQTADRARRAGVACETRAAVALGAALPGGCDIAMCSLFVHHLEDGDVPRLMRSMADAAERGVVISDLSRSRAGLAMAWFASRAVTTSHVVHTDAVRSVEAALTPREALGAARGAGLAGATVERVWPERWLLTWRRDGGTADA